MNEGEPPGVKRRSAEKARIPLSPVIPLLPERIAALGQDDAALLGWLFKKLSDRWMIPILLALRSSPLRFSALEKALGRVSHRMLIRTLKNLERDGLVCRRELAHVPIQVSYALTGAGRSLVDNMTSLLSWSRANCQGILDANRRFDDRDIATGEGR